MLSWLRGHGWLPAAFLQPIDSPYYLHLHEKLRHCTALHRTALPCGARLAHLPFHKDQQHLALMASRKALTSCKEQTQPLIRPFLLQCATSTKGFKPYRCCELPAVQCVRVLWLWLGVWEMVVGRLVYHRGP
jgi:hypothetical protein